MGNPVQTLNVFISHATPDLEKADALQDMLRRVGHQVFAFKRTPTVPGQNFKAHLDQAVAFAHVFIVLWSSHSEASSWVAREIAAAQRADKLIIPVLLEKGLASPDALHDVQAVVAYENPSGWVMRVHDALNFYVDAHNNRMAGKELSQTTSNEGSGLGTVAKVVIGAGIVAGIGWLIHKATEGDDEA
ncbi:MAG: toll/interleukin-1 receptor domain-containing protein [Hyphomicrobiaceae bacterium]